MTEYITKEQAIDVINTAFVHIYDTDSETVSLVDLQNEIIMTIEQHTEPADVAPVVHAHWITDDDDYWTCSNCRKFIPKDCAHGCCPKCNARMDGEDL